MAKPLSKMGKFLLALGLLLVTGTLAVVTFLYFWELGFSDPASDLTMQGLWEVGGIGVGFGVVCLLLSPLAE